MSGFPQNMVPELVSESSSHKSMAVLINLNTGDRAKFHVRGWRQARIWVQEQVAGSWTASILEARWSIEGSPPQRLLPSMLFTPSQPYSVVPIDVSTFDDLVIVNNNAEGAADMVSVLCRLSR